MSEFEEIQRRKGVFGSAVDEYDRTRPTYVSEAIAWCLGSPSEPLSVVDLGAGTGKLSHVLVSLGMQVIAVEHDQTMLDRLAENGAGVDARLGTAEAIPVEGPVDAVIAGQAWHWFDQAAAGLEVGRIIRPGGWVSAVWNSRDESVDWVRQWSTIAEEWAHPTGRKLLTDHGPEFGPDFGPVERATFRHEHPLTRDDVVGLVASRSYTIALPPDQREAMLNQIRELVQTHPDLAGDDQITMPYSVECFRAQRV